MITVLACIVCFFLGGAFEGLVAAPWRQRRQARRALEIRVGSICRGNHRERYFKLRGWNLYITTSYTVSEWGRYLEARRPMLSPVTVSANCRAWAFRKLREKMGAEKPFNACRDKCKHR